MDFIASTQHDRFARLDYLRLKQQGMRFGREGVRWHLVEKGTGRFDFSSVLPVVNAAREAGAHVIWDLCHFGWPDGLDLFKPAFVRHLARYGAAFAQWLANETGGPLFFVPVNEISFFSWASGDEGSMYPFAKGRGFELKCQLVRAAIETMERIWAVTPAARFLQVDPVINVVADPRRPWDCDAAESYRLSQYQAWDMLAGREAQFLGGSEKYLDLLGINFYPHNQWVYNLRGTERIGELVTLSRRHPLYRPFREMLLELTARYSRPILIAETGAEDRRRAGWLRYVCSEVAAAQELGVEVQGICLYPILNHPGWVDDRHCHNGLWDYPDEHGNRPIYEPLARELARWRKVFEPVQVKRAAKSAATRHQTA